MFKVVKKYCKKAFSRSGVNKFKGLFLNVVTLKIFKSFPNVMTAEQTIDFILENNASIARFGDGEVDVMIGGGPLFQKYDAGLAKELKQAAKSEKCFVCLSPLFNRDKEKYTQEQINFWKNNVKWRAYYYKKFFPKQQYGDAYISRFYITMVNRDGCRAYAEKLKTLWDGRDIAIIEGCQSRIGMGNDLFANTKSIKRILGPKKNAYDRINEIHEFTKANIEKETLVILALGPSATALAFRLANDGFQALDLGHADIEYEWMLMGVQNKVALKNKYVNEVIGGNNVEDTTDKEYKKQILADFS